MLHIISQEEDANLDDEMPLHTLEMIKMKRQITQCAWVMFCFVGVFFPEQKATRALLLGVQSVTTAL